MDQVFVLVFWKSLADIPEYNTFRKMLALPSVPHVAKEDWKRVAKLVS